MHKILCVFGTRPEAIKMAPVIQKLRAPSPLPLPQGERIKERVIVKVCVTAQHRSMLDEVLEIFKIRPDYDLNIMEEGQTLEQITKKVVERISPLFKKEKPDLVLVQGDTSTTLLATLAAFYQKIPVGHVEGGLRSYNYSHPFPEEANRRVADAICHLHFAPTLTAKKNLLKENIPAQNIFVTGNTVIDALQWAVSQPHEFSNSILRNFFNSQFSIRSSQLILVTAHRRENFGKPLQNICKALKNIADTNRFVRILYPVHLNPNVQQAVKKNLGKHARIILLPPLNYLDFSHLIKRCSFVVTDSGGLQEEAPALGKPVLVLREMTERPEAVEAGTVRVIGTSQNRIVTEISRLLTDPKHFRKMAMAINPYGDGKASERIRKAIFHYFNLGKKPKDFLTPSFPLKIARHSFGMPPL